MSAEDMLFDVPEMLSPRLAWLRKHEIQTHHAPHVDESPWCAWLPSNIADGDNIEGIPNDPEACGYGMTEDDALADLAKMHGLKLWSEESPI